MKKITHYCIAILLSILSAMLSFPALATPANNTIEQYGMLPVYGFDIQDGVYSVTVESDSSLLKVVLADITVADGKITAKLMLSNENLSKLFVGHIEQLSAEKATQPDQDGVFTIPVRALDTAISLVVFDQETQSWQDCSILLRADSLPQDALSVNLPDYDLIEQALDGYQGQNSATEAKNSSPVEPVAVDMEDGEYSVSVDLTGGSGKATVSTPTVMLVKGGKAYARIVWSSSNYDYMIVGTETYYNTSQEEANSVFEIPIGCWDSEMPVIADTTAMGTPHEVSYELTFYEASIGEKGQLPQEAAKRVVITAMIIIVGGGILNYLVKKKSSV